MLPIQIMFWLAISTLYVGFAGVMGILINRTLRFGNSRFDLALAFVHGFLLFLPATVLVLAMEPMALSARLLLIGAAFALVWLSAAQPSWLPHGLWEAAFGHRYLAGAMWLAALCGILLTLAIVQMSGFPTREALAPMLVAASALLAGAASVFSSSRHI